LASWRELPAICIRRGAEPLEKRNPCLRESLFELPCAIALAAGPRFPTIQVATIFTCVRVLYAKQFEVFFPIGPFLCKWCRAEANFHPTRGATITQPGVFHVPEIFIAGDGTVSQRFFINGAG
jgi:hypothetical protein